MRANHLVQSLGKWDVSAAVKLKKAYMAVMSHLPSNYTTRFAHKFVQFYFYDVGASTILLLTPLANEAEVDTEPAWAASRALCSSKARVRT